MQYLLSNDDRLKLEEVRHKTKKITQTVTLGGALLPLAACTGGGSPNPTTTPPPAEPTTSNFVEVATNEWEADSDLPGTFDGSASTDNLTVTGMGGDDTITTGSGDDRVVGGAGADTLDGGDNRDWLDYSDSNAAVMVDLSTNTVSGGHAEGDTIVNFELVIGSEFSDTITGDASNNTIQGGAGADTLDGGAGNDWLDYRLSAAGVTANLLTGNGSGGEAEGDVFTNFEYLTGSEFNDTLTGDAGNNALYGNSGADTINGGDGNDTLKGGDGADTINGGDGVDFLFGGAGADNLDGGAGLDWLTYSDSPAGVTVNLLTGVGVGSDAEGDVLSNFTYVIGSDFDDTLTGDAGNNDLYGEAGADTINGGDGNDRLRGETGNDILNGEDGDDIMYINLGLDGVGDQYDGGIGEDSIAINQTGAIGGTFFVDFSTIDAVNIEKIDMINVGGSREDDLTITAQDVLDVTDGDDLLIINGDADDDVHSTGEGWVQGVDVVIGPETYNTYTSGLATLYIDEDIVQDIS